MTTPTVPSITDEQLAEIERQCEKFAGFAVNSTLVEQLITRLRAAERDAQDLRENLRSANASLEASYGYCKQYRERMESAEDKLSAIRAAMQEQKQ